ncbi:uncharacterized protein LOC141909403 [Tubulanus polymorphus]|uniref:uncharacterized protein LOC141909403 n=1 Tax=Tubulanus polymorphus TaxID=672921 RepID=UPI003DA34437
MKQSNNIVDTLVRPSWYLQLQLDITRLDGSCRRSYALQTDMTSLRRERLLHKSRVDSSLHEQISENGPLSVKIIEPQQNHRDLSSHQRKGMLRAHSPYVLKTTDPKVEESVKKSPRFLHRSLSENDAPPVLTPKREPGRWVGSGLQSDPALLTKDRGYLLWTNPKGTMEVMFRYGESAQNFSCYIDPQYRGVKVSVFENDVPKQVTDGLEDPRCSTSKYHKRSPFRNRPENNFELTSSSGEVKLLLEAIKGTKFPSVQSFKINYVMAL